VRTVRAAGGASAVEITARFDDTVVALHHLSLGPRGPSATTRLLLGIGALALAAAIGLLAWAAAVTGGLGGDAPFLLAVLTAATCLPLGALRLRDQRAARDFDLGAGSGVSFPVAGELLPAPRFSLLRMTDDGFVFQHAAGMTALHEHDGVRTRLPDPPAAVHLDHGQEGRQGNLEREEVAELLLDHVADHPFRLGAEDVQGIRLVGAVSRPLEGEQTDLWAVAVADHHLM